MRPSRRRTQFFLASILLFGACFPLAPALALLIQNEPSGFRGNHWGASPRDCASLTFVSGLGTTESGQQVDVYDRSTVGISLNGATLTRMRYRFLDNQLESVQLSYEGRANRDRLLQVMEDRYGRLTPGERKVVSRNEWDGFETIVVLSFNADTGMGSLWFLSTALNREYSDYRFWSASK
jgi:hypothetical protein